MKCFLIVFLTCATSIYFCFGQQQFLQLRSTHIPKEITDEEIEYLANLSDKAYTEEILDNILIPRVVGTPNHEKVLKYIIRELKKAKFHVELDEFQAKTPNFGVLQFSNVIATLNPNAERFLVLSCHYDSKYFANEDFLGATDSAVPCAMMLNLAKVMKKDLERAKNNDKLSLKLIFFDGEEAFKEWGPDDSIYGARHLAQKYEETENIVQSTYERVTDIHRIDVLILLDLLGAQSPKFYSFFKNTEKWYLQLINAEECLANRGLLENYSNKYFQRRSSQSFIEDDHIPFLRRGVPILHIITTPFPKSWHTPADNRKELDTDTIENLNKILRVFVAQYLHLNLLDKTNGPDIPEKEL